MTDREFCYWLNGFVELTQGQMPNPAQWKSICQHLGLVFNKVTPPVGVKHEITLPADFDQAEFMRKWHESMPPTQSRWPDWPGIVTC